MKGSEPFLTLVEEYNSKGHLLYLEDYPGAWVRGQIREQALSKIPAELSRYALWSGEPLPPYPYPGYRIRQSQESLLAIEDADTDILFDSERRPLSEEEYLRLKGLALKSARDFLTLYDSIPDTDLPLKEARETFYGQLPATARAMYQHVKGVNSYYFDGIGLPLRHNETLLSGRQEGFERLEKLELYLENAVFYGSDSEAWTLRKVLRRLIWHDAIHAKAMYRSSIRAFHQDEIANPFCFLL